MSLKIDEQELGINMMRSDGYAIVDVSDTRFIKRFDAFCEESPAVWQHYGDPFVDSEGEIISKKYKCLPEAIRFRAKKPTRTFTEEQKQELRDRMRNLHQNGESEYEG